jgi:hypothetical protein
LQTLPDFTCGIQPQLPTTLAEKQTAEEQAGLDALLGKQRRRIGANQKS